MGTGTAIAAVIILLCCFGGFAYLHYVENPIPSGDIPISLSVIAIDYNGAAGQYLGGVVVSVEGNGNAGLSTVTTVFGYTYQSYSPAVFILLPERSYTFTASYNGATLTTTRYVPNEVESVEVFVNRNGVIVSSINVVPIG